MSVNENGTTEAGGNAPTNQLPPTPPTLLSLMQVLCSGSVTNMQQRQIIRSLINEFLDNSVTAAKVFQNISQIVGYQTFVDTVEGLVTQYVSQCAELGIIPVGTHTPVMSTGEAKLSGSHTTPGIILPSEISPPSLLAATKDELETNQVRNMSEAHMNMLKNENFIGIPKTLATTGTCLFDLVASGKRPTASGRIRKISMISPFCITRGFPTVSVRPVQQSSIMTTTGDCGVDSFCGAPLDQMALHSPVLSFMDVACGFPAAGAPSNRPVLEADQQAALVKTYMWTRFDRLVMMNTRGGLDRSNIHICGGQIPPVSDRSEYCLSVVSMRRDGDQAIDDNELSPHILWYSPFHINHDNKTTPCGMVYLLNLKTRTWTAQETTMQNTEEKEIPFLDHLANGVQGWVSRGEKKWLSSIFPSTASLEWGNGHTYAPGTHDASNPSSSVGAGMVPQMSSSSDALPRVKRAKKSNDISAVQSQANVEEGDIDMEREVPEDASEERAARATSCIVIAPSGTTWRLCLSSFQWSKIMSRTEAELAPGGTQTPSFHVSKIGSVLRPLGKNTYAIVGGVSEQPEIQKNMDIISLHANGDEMQWYQVPLEVKLSNGVAHFLEEILPSKSRTVPDKSAASIVVSKALLQTAVDRIGYHAESLPIYDDINIDGVFKASETVRTEMEQATKGPMNAIVIHGGANPLIKPPSEMDMQLESGNKLTAAFVAPLSWTLIRPVFDTSSPQENGLLNTAMFHPNKDEANHVALNKTCRISRFEAVLHVSRLIPETTSSLVSGLLSVLPENERVKNLTVRNNRGMKPAVGDVVSKYSNDDAQQSSDNNAQQNTLKVPNADQTEEGAALNATATNATNNGAEQIHADHPLRGPETLKDDRIREHCNDMKTLEARLHAVGFCVITMGNSYGSTYLAFPELLMGSSSAIDKICQFGTGVLGDKLIGFVEDTITLTALPFIISQGGIRPVYDVIQATQTDRLTYKAQTSWGIHFHSGTMMSYQGHTATISSRAECYDLLKHPEWINSRKLDIEADGEGHTMGTHDGKKAEAEPLKSVLAAAVYSDEMDIEDEYESDRGLNSIYPLTNQLVGFSEAVKSHALKTIDRVCLEDQLTPTSGLLANMVFSVKCPFTAIGNLVINSLSHGASCVDVELGINSKGAKEIVVSDDATGMDYRVLNSATKAAGNALSTPRGNVDSGGHGVGLCIGTMRLGHSAIISTRSARHVGMALISQTLASHTGSLETLVPIIMWSHITKKIISAGYGHIDSKHTQRLILQFSGYSNAQQLAAQMNFARNGVKSDAVLSSGYKVKSEPVNYQAEVVSEATKSEPAVSNPLPSNKPDSSSITGEILITDADHSQPPTSPPTSPNSEALTTASQPPQPSASIYGTGTRVTITELREGTATPFYLDKDTGAVRLDLPKHIEVENVLKCTPPDRLAKTDVWGPMTDVDIEEALDECPFYWKHDATMDRYSMAWHGNSEDSQETAVGVLAFEKGIHSMLPFWTRASECIDRNLATYLAWLTLHSTTKLKVNGAPLTLSLNSNPPTELKKLSDPDKLVVPPVATKSTMPLPQEVHVDIRDSAAGTLYRYLMHHLSFCVAIPKFFMIRKNTAESAYLQHQDGRNSGPVANNPNGAVLIGFLNVDDNELDRPVERLPNKLPFKPNGPSEVGILFYHNNRLINRYAIPIGASDAQLHRLALDGTPAISGVLDEFVIPPVTCIVELPSWYGTNYTKEGFMREASCDRAWSHLTECVERCVMSYCKTLRAGNRRAQQMTVEIPNHEEDDLVGAYLTPKLALEARLQKWIAQNGGFRVTGDVPDAIELSSKSVPMKYNQFLAPSLINSTASEL